MPHDTMTATSSSLELVYQPNDVSSNAINGIINAEDLFHSDKEYYPWLALDLGVGFLYKVCIM